MSRGHLRDLINEDPIRYRRMSPPKDRANMPRLLPSREAQPEEVERNVRIVHTIHGGSNLFVLMSNPRKRHVHEGRNAQHGMYNVK